MKYVVAIAIALALTMPARADKVGALAGAATGMVVAGPPGAIAGFFIGYVFGSPYWGQDKSAFSCYVDDNFHRVCPKLPLN
jgi:type III secretory pathway component EscT